MSTPKKRTRKKAAAKKPRQPITREQRIRLAEIAEEVAIDQTGRKIPGAEKMRRATAAGMRQLANDPGADRVRAGKGCECDAEDLAALREGLQLAIEAFLRGLRRLAGN
jgi:hypothetical protein